MSPIFPLDRVQIFGILFSAVIFWIIFSLVKNRRIKEEYSLLWLGLCGVFFYISIDRWAIDRLADLVGIAYKPSVLILIVIGFMTLILIHITIVITRLSEQSRELTQELGLTAQKHIQPKKSEILVIIPAYNEEASIRRVISELTRIVAIPLDIIVVNDGSRDQTGAIASELACVINLNNNLGIGGAVQTGFKYACRNNYQTAIQFDGDGQHIATEISKLLVCMAANNADMVVGSRFLQRNGGFRSTFLRRIGIRIFQMVNSRVIGQRITDNTSGFRAFNRRTIEFLADNYPIDYPEPESIILLGRCGYTICEVSTEMRERQHGGSSISGITGVYYMTKVLLAILMATVRNPLIKKQSNFFAE